MLFAASITASAQSPACVRCVVSLQPMVTLDDPAAAMRGAPVLVSAVRSGQIIVTEGGADAPAVFRPSGEFAGRMSRTGRGPGELTSVSWIDADLEDAVRAVDIDRIVFFDDQLRPTRTIVGPTPLSVWSAAFLRPDAYVSQSRIQDPGNPTNAAPLVVRSDSGRILARIPVVGINGQKTFVKLGRNLVNNRAFWMTEAVSRGLQGYRVVSMSEEGVRTRVFRQVRSWWVSADFSRDPVAALSRVQFVRQLDSAHLVVMIAQPVEGWRAVQVSPSNMANDRARYETVVEVIDARSGALLGSATVPGYPVSLLSDGRAAIYREDVEGRPRIEVLRLVLRSG